MPPINVTSTVVSRGPGIVRVRLVYDIAPFDVVAQDGKVVEHIDTGHVSEIDQMNYVNGQWRVLYVEYNA